MEWSGIEGKKDRQFQFVSHFILSHTEVMYERRKVMCSSLRLEMDEKINTSK